MELSRSCLLTDLGINGAESFGSSYENVLINYFSKKPKIMYRVFQKELHNGIPNVTVWQVLRKRLRLKELSIVQHLERWIVYTPLSINVFITLSTQ
jgi:hypothetical protein